LHAEREVSDSTIRESLFQSLLDNSVAYAVIENILADIDKITSEGEEGVKFIRDWRILSLIWMWYSL